MLSASNITRGALPRAGNAASLASLGLTLVLLAGCESLPALDRDSAATATVAAQETPRPALPPILTIEHNPRPIVVHLPPTDNDDADAAPAAPGDALERLRRGFQLIDADYHSIDVELDWYRKHQEYLTRVFTRARPYLPYIARQVESRGMPLEVALLPVVESAFDPFAYSHGRAAGLWQIIPGTGSRFGLKQNWWYDGRRDIVESTRAALDYLEVLGKLFDGDWLLAVASYNSGEGNVMRAVRNNKRHGKPTDFWHLKLRRETEAYVPRLLAIAKLVSDPGRYGVELPPVPDQPFFDIVPVKGQIDLALAAKMADMSTDDLYAFNAGFNRWATAPNGPHRLLIPVDHADTFRGNLSSLDTKQQVNWERHRIKSGETLLQLASRYRTTPAVIRKVNGIHGSIIRAGDYIMIPTATHSLSDYSLSADARLARTQSRERDGKRVEYTVSRGDSFWSISRRYKVGVRELAAWNGMAPADTLRTGQKLVVWTQTAVPVATVAESPSRIRQVDYTVRKGDSLSRIASRFSVSVTDLIKWNTISPDDYLQPGQKLQLYVDVTRQSG